MAGYVLDGTPAPPQLKEAWRIERWGLPNAGGTRDQPHGLLDRCSHVLNAHGCIQSYKNHVGRTAQWQQDNPKQAEFVLYVLGIRMDKLKNGQ